MFPRCGVRGVLCAASRNTQRTAATGAYMQKRSVYKFVAPFETPESDETYLPGPGKVFLPFKQPELTLPVYSLETKEQVSTIDLDPDVWDQEIRKDIVHRVIVWQTARRRDKNNEGTVFVKQRAEVRGSGRKLHQQKGTGRARVGDAASPIRRGGGKPHGPRPRKLTFGLQRSVRRLGLKIALTAKLQEGNVTVVSDLSLSNHRTRHLQSVFALYDLHRPLIVHSQGDRDQGPVPNELNSDMILASRNMGFVDFLPTVGCNVYDVVKHHELILTVKGVQELEQRLNKVGNKIKYVAPPLSDLLAAGEVAAAVEDADYVLPKDTTPEYYTHGRDHRQKTKFEDHQRMQQELEEHLTQQAK